jgi:hypothetical protein
VFIIFRLRPDHLVDHVCCISKLDVNRGIHVRRCSLIQAHAHRLRPDERPLGREALVDANWIHGGDM